MGKTEKQIGGVVAGAGLGTAGVITSNPTMAFTGAGMFLTSLDQLLFGETKELDVDETDASPERYLPVVYGTDVVAGGLVDAREDTNSEDIALVNALCHGSEDGSGVDDIVEVYMKSEKETAWSSGSLVTPYDDNIDILNTHLGSHSQSADSNLTGTFSAWTSDHAGAGVAYVAMFLLWNDGEVWSGGSVPEVHAQVKGNHVYDPRDGTWKYSENPALIALDYLTSDKYGLGANYPERDADGTDSEIHEQSWKDMATHCEDSVTLSFNDGTTKSQQRFKANGAVDISKDPLSNLERILTSCRGQIVYQEGEFRLHIPRSKSATSFTLDEDNIVGNWSFNRGGLENVPNRVKASYVENYKDDENTTVTWPEPGASNTYLSNDNDYLNQQNIELPFTLSEDRAKQIAMVGLKEARQDLTVELTAKQSALQLEVGDVVPVTHETPGWTDKKFWVRAITYDVEKALVHLKLREYDATAYSLDSQDKAAGPPGVSLPDVKDVDAPNNFTVQSGSTNAIGSPDGVQFAQAFLTWDDPSQLKYLDHYEIQFKKSANSSWNLVDTVQRGTTQHEGPAINDGTDYDFRIRSVNVAGFKSTWVTVTNHTASATGVLSPVIQVDHDQIDDDADGDIDTGKLIATLHEAGGSDLDYTFYGKSGRGDSFSSITGANGTVADGTTVSAKYALSEKVNTYIKIEVTSTSTNETTSEVQSFDPDLIPNFETFNINVNSDDTVTINVTGDPDTASGEINFSGDFSDTSETITFSGSSTTQTSTGTVTAGGTVTVSVTLYAQTGQSGTSNTDSADATNPAGTSDSAKTPSVYANVQSSTWSRAADNQVSVDIDLEVVGEAHPESGSPSMEVRYRTVEDGTASSWSNWQTSPHVFTITWSSRNPIKDVHLQSRDTGVSGSPKSSIESWQQAVPQEGTTDPTSSDGGKIDETIPTKTGGGIFIKGQPSDPDDATSVPLSGSGNVDLELERPTQNRLNTDAGKEQTLT